MMMVMRKNLWKLQACKTTIRLMNVVQSLIWKKSYLKLKKTQDSTL
jgi:hypothetical protein